MNVFSELTRPIVNRPGDATPLPQAAVQRQPRSPSKRGGPSLPTIVNPWGLSPSQAAVMQHVVEGRSNQEIADAMVITLKTVEKHRALALEKMEATSTRAAVLWDRFITGRSA